MPKATVELALTKNRKLLLACMLGAGIYLSLSNIAILSIEFFVHFLSC